MSRYHASLKALLMGLNVTAPVPDIQVSELSQDSRRLTQASLFVALKGAQVDARQFISAALEQGVAAIVYDDGDNPVIDSVLLNAKNVIAVRGLNEVLSEIAARFYDEPSKKLTLIGITGTNGKTTIAYYMAQMFERLGRSAAIIGTLGVGKIANIKATGMTTPDAIEIQRVMAEMVVAGVDTVCMEVSSHGLVQARVAALAFDFVVLSNLSQDHLDFHQTMAAYAAAKSRLFTDYPTQGAILNADDDFGAQLVSQLPGASLSYGIEKGDLLASDIELTPSGLQFSINHGDKSLYLQSDMVGRFNVYNLLAVLGTGLTMGYPLSELVAALAKCQNAPGRMERINAGAGLPVIVVDYAHTPDALDKALNACKTHCEGALSVVFGCGGDRDKGKRALMGRIAEQFADHVFVTDDNPRSESPTEIVSDIIKGMSQVAWVVHDRAQAIRTAIGGARADDWVLIAGKGHETRQIFADRSLDFDDRLVARQALERLAA